MPNMGKLLWPYCIWEKKRKRENMGEQIDGIYHGNCLFLCQPLGENPRTPVEKYRRNWHHQERGVKDEDLEDGGN